jgi:hypothetical protein
LSPSDFKHVAWSGIELSIPRSWEPARIGFRHLALESESGPAMEIKWGPVRGGFSSRRHLAQLSRQTAGRSARFRERVLPEDWSRGLSGFEAFGFEWRSAEDGAVGALIHCPSCRTASIIQFFFRHRLPAADPRCAAVLSSFSDHRTDGQTAWAIFDIHALLPMEFTLAHHRLEAGRFVLEFKGRRRKISLHRWAPARLLLKDRGLEHFARSLAGEGEREGVYRAIRVGRHPGVEFHGPEGTGAARRLKAWLGVFSQRRGRVWHVQHRNRILGALVEVDGRGSIDPALMDRVCDRYGMAGENESDASAEPQ